MNSSSGKAGTQAVDDLQYVRGDEKVTLIPPKKEHPEPRDVHRMVMALSAAAADRSKTTGPEDETGATLLKSS
jgi:hypothetical protein